MKKFKNFVKRKASPSPSPSHVAHPRPLEPSTSTGTGQTEPRSSVSGASNRRGSVLSLISLPRSGSNASSYIDSHAKGASKLHWAVWNGEVERVEKLAAKNDVGALNALDARGRTPLHLAATQGHPGIVETLLTHGATVHSKDAEGASPLHRAVQKGHNVVARTLLDRGAPLDGVDLKGDTVLHWAVRQGNADLVALILRKGANPDVANKAQECPLHEAIRLGQCDTALLLLRCGASVNVGGPQAITPLMLACTRDDTFTLVETLLDYEADPKALDQKGRDAIGYAKAAGQSRLVNLLQRFVNSQDADGPMEDSFDDDDDEFDGHQNPIGGAAANPLGLPLEPSAQVPLPLAKSSSARASVRSDAQGVPISDLSSWGSNSSPSIEPEPSKIKHSQGIMDLSKFLNSDDEAPPKDEGKPSVVSVDVESAQASPTKAKTIDEHVYEDPPEHDSGKEAIYEDLDLIQEAKEEVDKQENEDDDDSDGDSWGDDLPPGDDQPKGGTATEDSDWDDHQAFLPKAPSGPLSPLKKEPLKVSPEKTKLTQSSFHVEKKSLEKSESIISKDGPESFTSNRSLNSSWRKKRRESRSKRSQQSSLTKEEALETESESGSPPKDQSVRRRTSKASTENPHELPKTASLSPIKTSNADAHLQENEPVMNDNEKSEKEKVMPGVPKLDQNPKPALLTKPKLAPLTKKDASPKSISKEIAINPRETKFKDELKQEPSLMINQEILEMDRADLLVHIQKLEISLETEKAKHKKNNPSKLESQKIQSIETDNTKLKEELVHAHINHQHMEKRLQEQETENQMLQSRLEEAQKQFVNSAADLKAQVEAASKLEDEAKRWQTLAETHANSLLDLEKAREKLIHQERSLESLRSERELDSKKYQDKADVVQRNLHQMTLQAEDLQRKLNEANERIEALNATQENLKMKEDEVQRIQSNLDAKEQQVISLEMTVSSLKKSVEQMQTAENELMDSKIPMELDELRNKEKAHIAQIQELKSHNDQVTTELSALKRDRDQMEKSFQHLQERNVALEAKLEVEQTAKQESQTNALQSKIESQAHFEQIKDDLEAKKLEMMDLEHRVKDLESELKQRNATIDKLESKCQELRAQNSDLTIDAKVSKQEYLDIKEASCRKENLNNALKEKFQMDKEQLQQTVGTLESQKAHLKSQHQIETDKLQNEIITLEKDIAQSRNIIQHVEQDKQDLKATREDLEIKLQKTANEHKIEVDLLNKTLDSLREKSSNLSDERFALLSKERLQLEKDLNDALVDNEAMRKKLAELNELIKQRAVDEVQATSLLNSELVKTKSELKRLTSSLETKEKELAHVKRSLNQSTNEELLDKRKQLSNLENDKLEVEMQLKFSQQKITTYESHVEHLNERIQRLEDDFESVKEEKKVILGKLKKKEAEMEQINLQVVEQLKSQLKLEARKLEKEKDKVETLEQKQKDLERSSQRMQTCLEEVNRDLNHSDQEKKSLKAEINSVYEKIHILESKLDEEKRKSSNSYTKIAQLQELVSDQRSKTESSDRRIKQLNQEIQAENAKRREAEFKLEQNRNGNGQGEMSNQVVIESLESEMELLKKQNFNLTKKFEEANKKLVTVDSLNKKVKFLNAELQKKNKLIEDLEERLANIHEHEASSYQKEVRKFKLKYEIMARNELNQKLAEINAFLEDRAKEQSQNEKTKDEVMQNIQKDLGERLTQSKEELSGIKAQMQETERGIKQLQSQLHQREQELLLERSLRKQLEKQLGTSNELSNFKVNPFNEKPYIYL